MSDQLYIPADEDLRDKYRTYLLVTRVANQEFPQQRLCRRSVQFVHRHFLRPKIRDILLEAAKQNGMLPAEDSPSRGPSTTVKATGNRAYSSQPSQHVESGDGDATSDGSHAAPQVGAQPSRPVTGAFCFFGLSKCFDSIVLPSIQKHLLSRYPHFDIYV